MPTPIKARMLEYKEHEHKLMIEIFNKFGLKYPLSAAVKKIDREMLDLEWDNLVINDNPHFKVWSADNAKNKFLKMYNKLFQ
jgi:hypothetical protein